MVHNVSRWLFLWQRADDCVLPLSASAGLVNVSSAALPNGRRSLRRICISSRLSVVISVSTINAPSVVPSCPWKSELLARKIGELMQDRQKIEQMAVNSSRLAPKDAAGRVATTMEKYTTHESRV